MRRLTLPLTIALFATLFAAELSAAPAQASKTQASVFQDDHNLIFVSDSKRNKVLNELRGLGVDILRVNVIWNQYAKAPKQKTKPKSFKAGDWTSYRNYYLIDKIVAGARARGIAVLLTPTTPAPAWASQCKHAPVNRRRVCKPRSSDYATFVGALARRYPGVNHWSLINEPNLGAWLQPQWEKVRGHYIRRSPTLYRNLARAGIASLRRNGHAHGNTILLGETAPIGRTRGPYYKRSVAPGDFYRELFCLNSKGRKLGGKAAKVRGCNGYKRLLVNGVAHHPYTAGAGRPLRAPVGSGDITLTHMNRLYKWLDRGAKRGRIRKHMPVWITEFGFQTNPPDRFAGTSLRNQAKWINQADRIAWGQNRIRTMSQYELRDEPLRAAFNTGLRFKSGKAKPSLGAYRLPIWPTASRKVTRVWFQVRPASRLGTPQKATVQYRKTPGKKFRKLKTVTVRNKRGFFYLKTRVHAKLWRIAWKGRHSRSASP
jgi:hypothetical protein